MSIIAFADVVHQNITFSDTLPHEKIVLELCDTKWVQRLRDISQTANNRLVYMFSEHSRFGHSLGVANLANILLDKLSYNYAKQVAPWRTAINAAAILHDVGHIAPGSHSAYKAWFPDQADYHEEIGEKIITQESEIRDILLQYSSDLPDVVSKIIMEDPTLPPWVWELISGGGWNVDRGNWCIVDSILSGVSYGTYNIAALTDSIIIDNDHLVLKENRLDAMMHFMVSRHAMYRQMYQHRVLLSADTLAIAMVDRIRQLSKNDFYADETMLAAVSANTPQELSLKTIFNMRESWWKYHLTRWSEGTDDILKDLSNRLLYRNLLKTVRINDINSYDEIYDKAKKAVMQCGYDPKYYLHKISTYDANSGEARQSMPVLLSNGEQQSLSLADPLFNALTNGSTNQEKSWLVMPKEAKILLLKTI